MATMAEAVEAVKTGADTVRVGDTEYDVRWFTEPGDDLDDRPSFKPRTVTQLVLRPVEGGETLSFYGPDRDVCVQHLEGYLARSAA